MNHDDFNRLRSEADDADDRAGREPDEPPSGAARFAAITVEVTTYPTTAAAFYGWKRRAITGTEVEGGSGVETTTGGVGYAFNLGDAIPPVGTQIEVCLVPFRFVFTHGAPRTT